MSFSVTENSYQSFINFSQTQPVPIGQVYGKYSIRTIHIFLEKFDQKEWIGEKKLHLAEVQFSVGVILTIGFMLNINKIMKLTEVRMSQ